MKRQTSFVEMVRQPLQEIEDLSLKPPDALFRVD
jgi:hypothetical protein